MGKVSLLGELLWTDARYSRHRRSTTVHKPELFSVWNAREEIPKYAYAYLSELWSGAGQRSQCRSQYPGKRIRTSRCAHGNRRTGLVKRFWTDCLYSFLPTEDEQAGWMKEEPPVIYAGECQKNTTPSSSQSVSFLQVRHDSENASMFKLCQMAHFIGIVAYPGCPEESQ